MVGIITVPALVLVSITGSALIFYQIAQTLLLLITASPERIAVPIIQPPEAASRQSLDRLLAVADRSIPDGISTFIHFPEMRTSPLAVRKRLAQESHRNGRTFVYLDPYTAEGVHIDHALQASAGVRFRCERSGGCKCSLAAGFGKHIGGSTCSLSF